ncbi:MAG: uroporphyrinogen-III C-methyltransferase [Zoogloeaceae bacterium]|nr:uroporphyrinogen-III C-methyltransferase [Zoogloeaceae bacterium]
MDISSSALPGQGTSPATLAELAGHLVARASLILKRPPADGRVDPSVPEATHGGPGRVALVGAGPGDPELLTLRAARLIAEAEVLVFDHLVTADVLTLAAPGAERLYVGKKSGSHTLPQGEINQLLIRLAQSGRRVVRLKGGDPFVFGRGGEEVEDLVAAGVPFEVVPGITAACGVAAYAGIPLTHRDHAQSVVFATGHVKPGGPDADWLALARPRQTAVIYMGVGALADLCAGLIAHGRGADTPAALVENGTTRAQRVVSGTLRTLPDKARWAAVKPPALLIVGEVVALAGRLDWFTAARRRVAG